MSAARKIDRPTLAVYVPPPRRDNHEKWYGYHARFLTAYGVDGLTDDELSVKVGVSTDTAHGRRSELVTLDYLVKSTDRRPTRTGRWAAVWKLTARGRAKIEALQNERPKETDNG